MESAAALANQLHDILHVQRNPKPSETEIEALLQSFSKPRVARTKGMLNTASTMTRMQTGQGLFNRLLSRYVMPYLLTDRLPPSLAREVMVEAEKLSFVPLPKRAHTRGWRLSSSEGGQARKGRRSRQRRAWNGVRMLAQGLGFVCVAVALLWSFYETDGPSRMLERLLSHRVSA